MNKMKSVVMTVLVLVFAGFSLHAETKIDENKLTDLNYLSRICKVAYVGKLDTKSVFSLDNGEGIYVNNNFGLELCVIRKNGNIYGRHVSSDKDGNYFVVNLHDNTYYTNLYIPKKEADAAAKRYKGSILQMAKELGIR